MSDRHDGGTSGQQSGNVWQDEGRSELLLHGPGQDENGKKPGPCENSPRRVLLVRRMCGRDVYAVMERGRIIIIES